MVTIIARSGQASAEIKPGCPPKQLVENPSGYIQPPWQIGIERPPRLIDSTRDRISIKSNQSFVRMHGYLGGLDIEWVANGICHLNILAYRLPKRESAGDDGFYRRSFNFPEGIDGRVAIYAEIDDRFDMWDGPGPPPPPPPPRGSQTILVGKLAVHTRPSVSATKVLFAYNGPKNTRKPKIFSEVSLKGHATARVSQNLWVDACNNGKCATVARRSWNKFSRHKASPVMEDEYGGYTYRRRYEFAERSSTMNLLLSERTRNRLKRLIASGYFVTAHSHTHAWRVRDGKLIRAANNKVRIRKADL